MLSNISIDPIKMAIPDELAVAPSPHASDLEGRDGLACVRAVDCCRHLF